MAIIQHSEKGRLTYDTLLYKGPDQLVSDKRKESHEWWRENMDYYWTIATAQYRENKDKLKKNYELVKGELTSSDFYKQQQNEVKSFIDELLDEEDLPSYVKHYSIMTPPLNTMIGEMSKRPDNIFVKAYDEDSKSEELEYRSELLQKYIIDTVKTRLQTTLAMKGIEIDSPEQFEQMTSESVEDYLTNYTSLAERWGSKMLENLKARFSVKEKSEEGFRDLLISCREAFHIYEDGSDIGFNVETENPIEVWKLTLPSKKYISDPMDYNNGAFAAGTVKVMELSEIINRYNITEEEVEHLRKYSERDFLLNARESNLVNPKVGEKGIQYDTYDPALYKERLENDPSILDEDDYDILGPNNTIGTYGYKYTVVTAYWLSKKKIGELTYIDSDGIEQVDIVDENYKKGDHPNEVSLKWAWKNQWYQGIKIGNDIYYVKPFTLLEYCPILGVTFEGKNAKAASLIDQMKPYQILYNVAMNQLFRLLEKDMGNVFLMSLRHVPLPKDGDYQDAVELWESEAREKGIIFVDDSPENLKSPSSFNQFNPVNLSRAQEIQIRYQLAVELRNECWKLVGLTEQRLGSVAATETATGTNAALNQSYAQTEPWFAQHEYMLNKLYQALLDAAMYIESHKPESTISYISSEGTHSFIKVNGNELLRKLGVYVTSRQDDAENLRQLKMLAQSMLQNGAHPYDISVLFGTKSSRYIQDTFKKLKKKQEEYQERMQQIEEQKIQQAEEQFARQQELLELQEEKKRAFEAYENEQDRLSKEKIAYMQLASKNNTNADTGKYEMEERRLSDDFNLKMQEITRKQKELLSKENLETQKLDLENRKLDLEKYKIDQQKEIEKIKLKNKVPGEK